MNRDDLKTAGITPFNRNSLNSSANSRKCRIIGHRVISDDYVNYDKNVAFMTALQAMHISAGAPAPASRGNDSQPLGNAYGNNNAATNVNANTPFPRNTTTTLVQRKMNYHGSNLLNHMAISSWAHPPPDIGVNARSNDNTLANTTKHTKLWYSAIGVDLNKCDARPQNGNAGLQKSREAVVSREAILVKNHWESPPINNTETFAENKEPDYPELALDLQRVKQRRSPVECVKSKPQADDGAPKKSGAIAACKATRVALGRPLEPFLAKYSDPVELELERWHNSHNSTLRWKRLRRGHYKVNSLDVELLKLNGTLYVKGHGIKRLPEQVVIQRFAQHVQNMPREAAP